MTAQPDVDAALDLLGKIEAASRRTLVDVGVPVPRGDYSKALAALPALDARNRRRAQYALRALVHASQARGHLRHGGTALAVLEAARAAAFAADVAFKAELFNERQKAEAVATSKAREAKRENASDLCDVLRRDVAAYRRLHAGATVRGIAAALLRNPSPDLQVELDDLLKQKGKPLELDALRRRIDRLK